MSTTLIVVASATPSALLGALVVLMPALRMRSRAAIELVAADAAVTKAEELLTEYDRTRNLPWYWPTGPAVEAAKPHEAEVLHVAYPTQELRLVEGLAALADEVGLVQATTDQPEHTPSCPDLYYCPTVDEVESGCHGGFDVCCVAPELHRPIVELRAMPVLSDRPAEDEDEVGDEQPGEAASSVPSRLKAWASDLVDRVHDWLPNLLQQWRERNDVGTGEQFGAEDPFAVDPDQPNDYDPVTGQRVQVVYPTPEPVPVRIVRVNRYRDPGMTGQFPYVKVAGAPRHAAPEPEMPAVNAAIPAQRTDGDEL